MVRLSVNINKIATIRNARGGQNPDVPKAAVNCELYGAEGITVHPRPDQRHIRFTDVYEIKKRIGVEFNIEGYPTTDFLKMVKEVKPTQVTLVPDPPEALTSSAGWDTKANQSFLKYVIAQFHEAGIRTSIFVDTKPVNMEFAATTGTDRIELYTEPYATLFPVDREKAIAPFIEAAKNAQSLNLGINAGHDLSLENLNYFAQNIPGLLEVSIGHALISDALYYGLENTIQMYLQQLRKE